MKTSAKFLFWILVLALTLGSTLVSAQGSTKSKKWRYLGEVYMWFPSMSGEIGIADLPAADVNADVGDILGKLKMGAMLYFEATNDDWSVTTDFIYMKLGQDVTPGKLVSGGEVRIKEMAWEVTGFKRLVPWFDIGLGGRLVGLNADLDLETVQGTKSIEASKTWFDPIIVIRSDNLFDGKWIAQMRLDAGGLGVGSDFTWQVQANAGYRFSKLFQTTIGYRFFGIYYDKGEGAERFRYDVDTYGFVFRLGFNF
jgi:hypothetical protein